MKQNFYKLISVFLLSAAVLAYELVVMRVFAVGSWSNFGSMVISIALLGFGLAGTFLTFVNDKIKRAPEKWLSRSALILPFAMTAAHFAAQQIPFNPVMIASDSIQLWWIGAYYAVYSVPFICGALFIGISFIALSGKIHKLYFWNMVGSGAGGLVVLISMFLFPPDMLILPVLVIAWGAGMFCFLSWGSEEEPAIKKIYPVISTVGMVLLIVLVLFAGKIKVSDFKSVSYIRKYPEYNLEHYSFSPLGEMHLYSSSYFHFAPGLSDTAGYELNQMPQNAFKGLYIDGGGPIGIMKKMDSAASGYIDYLPMAAPYKLLDKPDVLMVKLGGGIGVFTALHNKAKSVDSAEPNPEIVKLFKEVPAVKEFSGNLLEDPRVNVIAGEPRAYCATTKKKYDLVEISLIDAVGLAQTGGYPVVENFTYTSEAIGDYMATLKPGGFLSITVWNKLSPPRNVLRLLSTVVDSLEKQGVEDPASRIYSFQLLLQTATVIVKNSAFTEDEIGKLNRFCDHMAFETCYYPGMPYREGDFDFLLNEYTGLFFGTQQTSETEEESPAAEDSDDLFALLNDRISENEKKDLLPGDLYHFALKWMLEGKKEEFLSKYIFDVRPATDNRPYYTAYLKTENIPAFMGQLNSISEEWGYILLLGTLIQSILFAGLIILIPIIGKWKELFKKNKGTGRVILYYACLGLGYMLVEIFLIQKLVFFLEDPIISLSLVITSMLIISGIGSLVSQRFNKNRANAVRGAVVCIAVSLVFYMTLLSPILEGLTGLPLILKSLTAVILVAPAAFFMGIPFPNGLTSLSENRKGLIPWAWGMNGALSVTGSVLTRLISVSYGFNLILVGALALYATVGIIFKVNEIKEGA